jgi:hypothetical protein
MEKTVVEVTLFDKNFEDIDSAKVCLSPSDEDYKKIFDVFEDEKNEDLTVFENDQGFARLPKPETIFNEKVKSIGLIKKSDYRGFRKSKKRKRENDNEKIQPTRKKPRLEEKKVESVLQ